MRRLIVLALLLSLVVLSTLSAQKSPDAKPYTPLTRDQAKAWLGSITIEQLEDFVIRYDYIEHSLPAFDKFTYLAVVTNRDVYVQPLSPTVDLTIGNAELNLKYKLALPTFTYKGIIPSGNHFFRDAGIGAGIGVVVTSLVFGLITAYK
jgi:hypothetical protein